MRLILTKADLAVIPTDIQDVKFEDFRPHVQSAIRFVRDCFFVCVEGNVWKEILPESSIRIKPKANDLSVRQIMTKEIKMYDWCNSTWRHQIQAKEQGFETWLNSLDDDDFLMEYNSTRKIINNLD